MIATRGTSPPTCSPCSTHGASNERMCWILYRRPDRPAAGGGVQQQRARCRRDAFDGWEKRATRLAEVEALREPGVSGAEANRTDAVTGARVNVWRRESFVDRH
jgi:hypothetical protein